MKIQRHSGGSEFEEKFAYSRVVRHGNLIYVAGTTGFDYTAMTISDDVAEQADQCLKNIDEALKRVGSSLQYALRVHYIFPDAADFPKCADVFQHYFGDNRPAATMFVAGLADPRMKIEIEVTATLEDELDDTP